jgi:hypothetical protein
MRALVYQRRFRQLQQEVRVSIEAADRGDVIDADVMFQDLRNKLQQKRAQWFDEVDRLDLIPHEPVNQYQEGLLDKYRNQGLDL